MTRARRSSLLVLLVLVALPLVMGSCSWSIGKKHEHETSVTRPTLAQELRDLRKTMDEGIITVDEYEKAKADLLAGAHMRGGAK